MCVCSRRVRRKRWKTGFTDEGVAVGDINGRIKRAIDERIHAASLQPIQTCRERERIVVLIYDIPTGQSDFGSFSARICVDPETDTNARDQLLRDWIGLWSGHTLVLDRGIEVKFNSSMTVDCWTPEDQPTTTPHELCEKAGLRYRYRWGREGCGDGIGLTTRITFNIAPPAPRGPRPSFRKPRTCTGPVTGPTRTPLAGDLASSDPVR